MIYLILTYDFDNLENSSSSAKYSTIVGYVNTREEAQEYVENEKKIDREFNCTYKGWDNSIYPQYEIKEVPRISQKRKKKYESE